MFLDEKNEWRPPEPPARRTMTERGQKIVGWLIFANIIALLVAPIGGATVVQALGYWIFG